MSKYWKIYKICFANSVSYFTQYRKDFWFNLFINLLWIGIIALMIEIIFGQTSALGGWNKGEVYLLTMLWVVSNELFVMFFGGNLFDLSDMVAEGVIDFYLLKPVNSLFLVSTKYILFRAFYRLLGEIAILVYVFIHFNFIVSGSNIFLGVLLFIAGLIAQYAIILSLNTLSFWHMRIGNINDAIGAVAVIGRYPLNIFSRTIKFIVLTILPVTFFAYVPAAAVLDRWPWYGIVYVLIFSLVLFVSAVLFWEFALKKYSSASS